MWLNFGPASSSSSWDISVWKASRPGRVGSPTKSSSMFVNRTLSSLRFAPIVIKSVRGLKNDCKNFINKFRKLSFPVLKKMHELLHESMNSYWNFTFNRQKCQNSFRPKMQKNIFFCPIFRVFEDNFYVYFFSTI